METLAGGEQKMACEKSAEKWFRCSNKSSEENEVKFSEFWKLIS